jgi:hypothetical protein
MNDEQLPYDIIFLKRRLLALIKTEEYEKCVVIKRWIDELMIFYKVEDKENKNA